jgi:DNA-binding CsgD family transcriptional regulator
VTIGKRPVSVLTAAEVRVLELISGSKTNREIASALGISPATVKRHVENIFRKVGLRSRVEAAIYGLTIKGCPTWAGSNCPLAIWRKGRDCETSKWAV